MNGTSALHLAFTFVASGAGALLAGYFGVVWALRQRRAERAFDRRAQWTEDMFSALHRAAHNFDRFFNILGAPDAPPSLVEEIDREVDEAYREVRRIGVLRQLYAPPRTAARLQEKLEAINTILIEATPTRAFDPLETRRARQFHLAHLHREAAGVLTEDMHTLLGYRRGTAGLNSGAK